MLMQIRRYFTSRKAQSTAEYAILIGLAVGAVVVMQVYLKRGVQAKIKDSTDLMTQSGASTAIGGQTLGTTGQYEPYYLAREQQQTVSKDTSEAKVKAGGEAVTSVSKEIEQKSVVVQQYDKDADYTK